MHILPAYIKFLWRSTNQHGVHSPFVYSLVTKCFYDRTKYSSYKLIREYRSNLLKSREKISVEDFGAGSKVFKTSEREVSKMAKTVGISKKRAKLLNRLVRYLKVEHALELGTSLGIGTAAMAAGNQVRITTVEGCPETAAVAEKNFKKFDFKNIDLRVQKFEEFLVERGRRTEKSLKTNSKVQIPNSNKSTTENSQPTTDNPQPTTDNQENFKFQILNSKGSPTENSQPTTESRQLTTDNQENSKFQIPNSKGFPTENSQPTTDNRESSKFQIPNSDKSTTENSQPTTHNPQPTTDNEENSKFQIPNSKGFPTEKSQLTTDNRQPTTDNQENSKFQIPNSRDSKSSFDLIYFDGNHQKEATLDYFEKLLPTAHNDSVFIFDDIHWSREMEEAWEEIKKHPAVKVTIDTFFWGFVFFRKEQEKEHFVIRL